MTVAHALKEAEIDALDAEVLLAHALGVNRTWIAAHPEHTLKDHEERTWVECRERRKKREPTSYITGSKEFYGRDFLVDKRVLIPRPATEGLIDIVLHALSHGEAENETDIDTDIVAVSAVLGPLKTVRAIVDVGTGSGCIGVTLKRLRPDLTVIATDSSSDALTVARLNAEKHDVSLTFLEGHLLKPIYDLQEPFIIVSNPPYLPTGKTLEPTVEAFEPKGALVGGETGGEIPREIMRQAQKLSLCRGIFLECRKGQIVF